MTLKGAMLPQQKSERQRLKDAIASAQRRAKERHLHLVLSDDGLRVHVLNSSNQELYSIPAKQLLESDGNNSTRHGLPF